MMSNQLVLLPDKLSFSTINGQWPTVNGQRSTGGGESGTGLIEVNTDLKFVCFGSIG